MITSDDMAAAAALNYCHGCTTPIGERVQLPESWTPGDAIPDNVTRHSTQRDTREFVFRDSTHGLPERIYLGKQA